MYISRNDTLCKLTNRIKMNIITFGNATVDPGWHGRVISPLFSRLYYIKKGTFSVTGLKGGHYTLKPGMWYLIPTGFSFDYECSEEMEHFYFHLKLCDFDENDLLKSFTVPHFIEYPFTNLEMLDDSLSSNNLADGLRLRQFIFDLILRLMEKDNILITTRDYSPCVYKALNYIKQNLSMQLSISKIAESIFVSKSTLNKHFKKELAVTVNEYIDNSVLAESARLLMTTNIPIHELSQKFGFSDQFYFSKKFKEKFGSSPSQYRKNKTI